MTYSTLDNPVLEFAFECRLMFTRVFAIPNVHNGGFRSAVLVDEGHFERPKLRGRAIPNSGGDYAHFRDDDTAVFDASVANAVGPALASMLIYVLMAVVLAFRPQGLVFSARR